ncbi:MAG: flagellar motor protein MotD [Steroidobacteraceae bacterium]
MARRRHHEEHANHEAWAIPYGDLVTLLLAFFVVMYSISSVNEGKYRVVSESLNAAFRGAPTTTMPIQLGQSATTTVAAPVVQLPEGVRTMALRQLAQEAEDALSPLIMAGLVDVQLGDGFVEISIRSDVLFASGVAKLAPAALPAIRMLGDALRAFPNSIRVEGHTDNVPVNGGLFPSNWELSAARAASVVHLLIESGVDPRRLSVAAFGEFRPVLPNTTADGRNANRRVVLTIVGSEPVVATPPAAPAPATGPAADTASPPP